MHCLSWLWLVLLVAFPADCSNISLVTAIRELPQLTLMFHTHPTAPQSHLLTFSSLSSEFHLTPQTQIHPVALRSPYIVVFPPLSAPFLPLFILTRTSCTFSLVSHPCCNPPFCWNTAYSKSELNQMNIPLDKHCQVWVPLPLFYIFRSPYGMKILNCGFGEFPLSVLQSYLWDAS